MTSGRRWAAAAILCGLSILVFITFRDVLVAEDDVLPGRDSVNLYVWEIYTRTVLATGKLPFWNPFHFAGTPHLADVQTTVLYPPAMLLRWLPPGAFLSSMAALHIWIAGAGVLFLARVIGLGWLAATAAAVAGMLGGSAGARLHNGHLLLLYCAAWLPWALGFAIMSIRRATLLPHPGLVSARHDPQQRTVVQAQSGGDLVQLSGCPITGDVHGAHLPTSLIQDESTSG